MSETVKTKGKIINGVGGLYSVIADGGRIFPCRARGIFRHSHTDLLVGDDVEISFENGEENAVIESVCERKNSLIRPPLANLDYVFVVIASASPEPALDMTDKLTAILEHNDIEPVIVVGKCELDREKTAEILEIYRSAGYGTFAVSCKENEGIEELRDFICKKMHGKTAAFAGASGVGKSTLINTLFENEKLSLDTGELSKKADRGKHTTRKVSLYPVKDFYIADTPGFSMLDFDRFDFMTLEELPLAFREINKHIGECKYTKCTHRKEEGCAVVKAVAENEIAKSRHENYVALYEILKNKRKWD